jgi:hypothetical protein
MIQAAEAFAFQKSMLLAHDNRRHRNSNVLLIP